MYHSASRSPAVARSQYSRWSFLITLTLRLQPGDDALIAAAHTGVAFVRFLVQLLTRAWFGRCSTMSIGRLLLLGCARGERGGSEHKPQSEGNHFGHFKPPGRPECCPKGPHTRC